MAIVQSSIDPRPYKSMPTSYRFRVHGRVQGVYFRQSTCERALALELRGWVANCADGSVEGLAGGGADALAALREWLQHGPLAARVERVEWSASDETLPGTFSVRR